MITITDEYMQEMIGKTKNYCIVILKPGPNFNTENARQVIWEHGRRNFSLKAEGLLPIVCPVPGNSGINGVGIFTSTEEETKKIMDGDPGVQEGIFIYEIHPCRSFPGDYLP